MYGEQFVVESESEEIFKGQKEYKLSNRKMKGSIKVLMHQLQ